MQYFPCSFLATAALSMTGAQKRMKLGAFMFVLQIDIGIVL